MNMLILLVKIVFENAQIIIMLLSMVLIDFVLRIVKQLISKLKITQLIDVLQQINVLQNLTCMLIGMQENVFLNVALIISQIIELKHVFQYAQHNGSILEVN